MSEWWGIEQGRASRGVRGLFDLLDIEGEGPGASKKSHGCDDVRRERDRHGHPDRVPPKGWSEVVAQNPDGPGAAALAEKSDEEDDESEEYDDEESEYDSDEE